MPCSFKVCAILELETWSCPCILSTAKEYRKHDGDDKAKSQEYVSEVITDSYGILTRWPGNFFHVEKRKKRQVEVSLCKKANRPIPEQEVLQLQSCASKFSTVSLNRNQNSEQSYQTHIEQRIEEETLCIFYEKYSVVAAILEVQWEGVLLRNVEEIFKDFLCVEQLHARNCAHEIVEGVYVTWCSHIKQVLLIHYLQAVDKWPNFVHGAR